MTNGTIAPNWIDRIAMRFGRVTKAQQRAPRPPLASSSSSYMTGPLSFPGWEALDARVTDRARINAALASPWVWSDVHAIANEFASASLIVKRRTVEGLEDIDNHPLEELWEQPNPHMGRSYVMRYWCLSYLLAGQAFLFFAPRGDALAEIWPIPPTLITPVPDENDYIRGYAFRASPQAQPTLIDRKYICHSRNVNLWDTRDGLSFLAAAMLSVETDQAAAAWNRNFFREHNGIPDGIITVRQETLDVDLARIRAEIAAFFGGTRRGVGVVRAGDMDYKPFARSQKDAEFLQSRMLDGKLIDRVLGFPEGYWSERANRANAEQARATMIAGAVWPLLVTLHEDLNAQIIPTWYDPNERAEFEDIRIQDRDLRLREIETRKSYLTIDELRALDGYEPLGDERGSRLVAEIGAASTTTAAADVASSDTALPPALLPEDGEDVAATETASGDEEMATKIATNAATKDAKRRDLVRWQRKALDALKAGKALDTLRFTPDALDAALTEALRATLAQARDREAVKAAFDSAFLLVEQDADELLDLAKEWTLWARTRTMS